MNVSEKFQTPNLQILKDNGPIMKNHKHQRSKSQMLVDEIPLLGVSLGFGVLGLEHLPAGLLAFGTLAFGIFNP
jgi:hypothetical protein